MLRYPRRPSHQLQQRPAPIHRLDRTQAQPPYIGLGEQSCKELNEAGPTVEVAPPAAKIDAGQHDFRVVRRQATHFGYDCLSGRAAATAPNRRNDAERAAAVAAILDLDVGAAAARGPSSRHNGKGVAPTDVAYEHAAGLKLPMVEERLRAGALDLHELGRNHIADPVLVGVSDDPGDPGERGKLLGSALGVAAGDQDLGPRSLLKKSWAPWNLGAQRSNGPATVAEQTPRIA